MQQSRFLSETGIVGSNINAIGDYSAQAKEFKIKPKPGEKINLHRLIVYIEDAGALDSGAYGNSVVLTNGIKMEVRKGGQSVWKINEQLPIKTNTNWKALCHDELPSSYGTGNTSVSYRYSFDKEGAPISLNGANGDEFVIILEDNFSGLEAHFFRAGLNRTASYPES